MECVDEKKKICDINDLKACISLILEEFSGSLQILMSSDTLLNNLVNDILDFG